MLLFYNRYVSNFLALATVKLTIPARIFSGGRSTFVAYGMTTLLIGWTIAFFFANLFQYTPIWENWVGWGGTAEKCINTVDMYLAQAYSDVVTDGGDPIFFANDVNGLIEVGQ